MPNNKFDIEKKKKIYIQILTQRLTPISKAN